MSRVVSNKPTMNKRTKMIIGEILDPLTSAIKIHDAQYALFNMGFSKRSNGGSHQQWTHKLLGLSFTLVDNKGSGKGKDSHIRRGMLNDLKKIVEHYMELNTLISYDDIQEPKIITIEKEDDDMASEAQTILQIIREMSDRQKQVKEDIKDIQSKILTLTNNQTAFDKQLKASQDLLLDLGARIEDLGTGTITAVVTSKPEPKLNKAELKKLEKKKRIERIKEIREKYPEFADNWSAVASMADIPYKTVWSYKSEGLLD
jgi:chromosome segregation ATPase